MKLRNDSRLKAKPVRFGDFTIAPVRAKDFHYWRSILGTSRLEFASKLVGSTAFVLMRGGEYAGLMHHSVLWDSVPMLNMVFVNGRFRNMGAGSAMVEYWEKLMRYRGYDRMTVCVPSDTRHQRFFRERGYTDCGSITFNKRGAIMPADLFLVKYI